MSRSFKKEIFLNDNESVEYVNLYLITALSALLYFLHGIAFLLYAYNSFLIVTQALSVCICVAAFFINRAQGPRTASIVMILLICTSINIWAYIVDVGNDMRWYAILALCPLYFFSILKKRDKIVFTLLITASFLSSTIITYRHDPVVKMLNAELYNAATGFVIFISIALELILYKYVSDKRDSELKRIGTILNNIECGIVIVDAETHELLDINPIAERLYEGGKDTVIGEKCHNLICRAQEGACPITDTNQEAHRSESVFVKANGETIPIIKSVVKIRYNDRSALLESFTDISDLKKAEEKLRLLEITEQANRAKSDFLSRMSHEMRTPMNAIIGMAKIAGGTDDSNRLKYCLSMIDISSSHLLGIINDILDMSKIESGKFELDSVPVHIEKVLMKVSDIMIEQAEKNNVNLCIFAENGTDAQYVGDEMRLIQIIINLISNAVKFTPSGGKVTLSVREEQKEDGFSILRFTISDTGIGMTKDQCDKLFTAFEQADGSITRKYGGTGLGLAISKSIVEKMGGRIWVESELEKGSTFTFDVKLERADKQSEKEIFFLPPTLKALVADSDSDTRRYFKSITEQYGIITDEAESVEKTAELIKLSKAARDPYNAIFLAYGMIDAGGFEIPAGLMEIADKESVILMTPLHTWLKIGNEARGAGFNRFIPKPFFPSSVIREISNVIGKVPPSFEEATTRAMETPDFSGVTILLAEDVKVNREIFITLLGKTNIEIDTAENGMEAVQKFKSNPDRYAAIIMDIQMPVMNGYEATEIIRSLDTDKARSIPIIALTADAFKEDMDRCIACGMNSHLKKPIELEKVIEVLSVYLAVPVGRVGVHSTLHTA